MIINKNKISLPNSEFLWLKLSSGVGSPYRYSLFWQKSGEPFSRKLLRDSHPVLPSCLLPCARDCLSLPSPGSDTLISFPSPAHHHPRPRPIYYRSFGSLHLRQKNSRIKGSFAQLLTAPWCQITKRCPVLLLLLPALVPAPAPLHPTPAQTYLPHPQKSDIQN